MPAGTARSSSFARVLPVVLQCVLQVLRGLGAVEQRDEGERRVLDGAHQADVDRVPLAELFAADVDLHVLRLRGEELLVREVGAEHEDHVGVLHRAVPGGEAEEPGHADVVRVVPLDVLLAAQGVHDRGLQAFGEGDDLVVGARDAGAGEDGDLVGAVEQLRGALQLGLCGDDPRLGALDGRDAGRDGLGEEHVARDDEHGDAALLDRGAHRDLEQARHLGRVGDVLDVDRALAEEVLRVGLLEVAGTDLRRGDVRSDREDRHAGAVRVVEAVDQVQVAGTAAARTHGEVPGQLGLGGGGERGRLLVADVLPPDRAVLAQRVGEAVEGVPGETVDPFDVVLTEGGDDVLGNGCHAFVSSPGG
ncbi:hypothetical protein QE359_000997 [Curtobacterium sp. SORGH_AS776]|nr:hypothetical protein [Curtobacterium sp. SORGH_AS_0776]